MPSYRDVKVNVTDTYGVPLHEKGIIKKESKNLITCYIQSQTDMRFKITVQYMLPVGDGPRRPDQDRNTSQMDVDVGQSAASSSSTSKSRRRSQSLVPDVLGDVHFPPPPPYHLIASLYLDGSPRPATQVFLILDPTHKNFRRGCKVSLEHGVEWGANGKLQLKGWVFRELGVEALLGQLELGEHSAMDVADGSDKPQRGQIEVLIERIVLSPSETTDRRYEGDLRPMRDQEEPTSVSSTMVSHTAESNKVKSTNSKSVRFSYYHYFDPSEDYFAKFIFYYRSEEVLRKLSFLDTIPSNRITQSKITTGREPQEPVNTPSPTSTAALKEAHGGGDSLDSVEGTGNNTSTPGLPTDTIGNDGDGHLSALSSASDADDEHTTDASAPRPDMAKNKQSTAKPGTPATAATETSILLTPPRPSQKSPKNHSWRSPDCDAAAPASDADDERESGPDALGESDTRDSSPATPRNRVERLDVDDVDDNAESGVAGIEETGLEEKLQKVGLGKHGRDTELSDVSNNGVPRTPLGANALKADGDKLGSSPLADGTGESATKKARVDVRHESNVSEDGKGKVQEQDVSLYKSMPEDTLLEVERD